MATIEIKYIEKNTGERVFPVTHDKAVRDSSGATLESRMTTINSTLNNLTENAKSDWEETDITSYAYILHKPNLGSASAKDYTDTITSAGAGLPIASAVYSYVGGNVATLNSAIGDKVDKVAGKGLSTQDFTTTYMEKLSAIEEGAEVNVQADWNVGDSSSDAYIKNKPTLGTASAKNYADTIVSGGTGLPDAGTVYTYVGTAYESLYNDLTAVKSIIPIGAEANVQSDWNDSDTGSDAYILNKPTLGTAASRNVANAISENNGGLVESGLVYSYVGGNVATLNSAIGGKVDAVEGKGLSTQDFTTSYMEKLSGIEAGAQVNTITSINGETGAIVLNSTYVGLGSVTNDAQVKRSEMGVANGVATLGADGLVPSSQLPSFVDDVVEYNSYSAFPATGESGKIYVATDTNLTYRWSGTQYTEISASLALGETSSTAFPGDRGKAIEDKVATIAQGAEVNVQSNWNETDDSSDAYILNKPTLGTAAAKGLATSITASGTNLPTASVVYTYVGTAYESLYNDLVDVKSTIPVGAEANVQSNWNESDDSSDAYILNKPTLGTAAGKAFSSSVTSGSGDLPTGNAVYTYVGGAYVSLYNDLVDVKSTIPVGAEANVQSDWIEDNTSSDAYILNKPTLGTAAAKNYASSVTSGSSDLPTGNAVYTYVGGSYVSLYNDIVANKHVKANWSESDSSAATYIQNKPTLGSAASKGVAVSITSSEAGLTPGSVVYTYVGGAYVSLYNDLVDVKATIPTGTASGKNYAASVTSGSGDLPTGNAVYTYVGGSYDSLYNDIVAVKGTIPSGAAASKGVAASVSSTEQGLTPGSVVYTYVGGAYVSLYNDIVAYGASSYSSLYNDIVAVQGTIPSVGSAAAKTYTTSVTSGSGDLPTGGAVYTYVGSSYVSLYNDIVAVKGTIPSVGTAAAKNFTSSVTSGSADLATAGAVYTYVGGVIGGQVNTISANQTNVTCPVTLANGQQYTVIYNNTGSTDRTVSVSTSYRTPDGAQINITVKAGGYGEINYYMLSGTTFARAL